MVHRHTAQYIRLYIIKYCYIVGSENFILMRAVEVYKNVVSQTTCYANIYAVYHIYMNRHVNTYPRLQPSCVSFEKQTLKRLTYLASSTTVMAFDKGKVSSHSTAW